ncbi:centrosomal protein of 85 kDa-like isoform X2 [Cebidichthys violaceus]|uniref:centrosomal protein of 85 kDa-like isoform X2 n=1 Tax=Cebidichthys violaceus TaxID=271503 RepID=UPI0035CB2740
MLIETSVPTNSLVKVREELLRQRELEIDRQKQQILQLHARIRENELRAQQVLQNQRGWLDGPCIQITKESAMRTPCKQPSDRLCCDEELSGKLAVAELEVLHLRDFFKQVTHKYTEEIRKLEEKIKTRDRYISSLKKKCQRESEQNQEKQQRIETLEKYLSDLPTLDKQEEVQQKAKHLEKTASRLQKSLEEGYALMMEKDIRIEMQAMREKALIASVQSLQQKVQYCFDDGVRLPMQERKLLKVENTQLLEQQDHSNRLIEHQKERIERLTMLLTQQQVYEGLLVHPRSHVEMPEVGRLLKEMSLSLLDLQALCSILAQRAQGKEPNLSLLLGMKSLSVSMEDSVCRVVEEEEVRFKLLEVSQLRRDIDDLRKSISDRYVQCKGDSCVSE